MADRPPKDKKKDDDGIHHEKRSDDPSPGTAGTEKDKGEEKPEPFPTTILRENSEE